MTTLVTGASGFIGSALVRKLVGQGRKPRCFVHPHAPLAGLESLVADEKVELVLGDITNSHAVREAMRGIRVVFHLAAIYKLWLPEHQRIYEVNVGGSTNLLLAAMAEDVEKVVFTSSIAAVGRPEAGELADESTRFNTWKDADHYMRSKWLSEQEALRFAANGLPIVIVNPAFPFGVGDRAPTPTGRFIVDALNNKVPGYPAGGFNVVDVDDVAEGHILAETRGAVGERYILGTHNVSYRDFYRAVTEVAGLGPIRFQMPKRLIWSTAYLMEKIANRTRVAPKLTYKAARYASRELFFDCRRAQEELGMPRTDLRTTIDKSVRWFRDNDFV